MPVPGLCSGYREEWLEKIEHAGVPGGPNCSINSWMDRRPKTNARPELLTESRKHKASKLLRQIPCIGPIRASLLDCTDAKRRIASAANDNSGPIVDWASRRATVRNTALSADNCGAGEETGTDSWSQSESQP